MNKTNIEWCEYTWNPVVGCKRGCTYCYAKKINDRFNKTPFSEMIFHEKRLNEPIKLNTPAIIFCGSMSDIEYWKEDWIDKITDICLKARKHTFMFLSKSTYSYEKLYRLFPENTMQGLTLTQCNSDKEKESQRFHSLAYSRPFLSIEPILGRFELKLDAAHFLEKIIVGAMTGKKPVEPKTEWIESVINCFPEDKIFWKSNIKTSRAFIEIFGKNYIGQHTHGCKPQAASTML